jgi:trehalose 6-phosphate phosphatase
MPEIRPGFDDLSLHAVVKLEEALAARPRGLFSDVDGTLSAIAPTPEAATLLPGVRALLEEARDAFDVVAVVSGRAAGDARQLVGVAGIAYIGNHGLERLDPDGTAQVLPEALTFRHAISATLATLAEQLAPRFPGLRIEPKGVTASVHVRNTPEPAAAEEAVYQAATAAAQLNGLRVTRGRLVVELRPPVDVDKGVAVAAVIRTHGLRGAIYLGDDRTDIDTFRALRRLTAEGFCHGVAVAVLHAEAPEHLAAEADVALASIGRVPEFLRWLLADA